MLTNLVTYNNLSSTTLQSVLQDYPYAYHTHTQIHININKLKYRRISWALLTVLDSSELQQIKMWLHDKTKIRTKCDNRKNSKKNIYIYKLPDLIYYSLFTQNMCMCVTYITPLPRSGLKWTISTNGGVSAMTVYTYLPTWRLWSQKKVSHAHTCKNRVGAITKSCLSCHHVEHSRFNP